MKWILTQIELTEENKTDVFPNVTAPFVPSDLY